MDSALAVTQHSPIKHRPEKKRKSHPRKDSSAPNQRKGKRRRTAAGSDDFSVNFSKIKISESNRVLRSEVRRSHSSSTETVCDSQSCCQTDAVSKDHCYSKASKYLAKAKDNAVVTSTLHLNVFIDLTSSKEIETSKENDPPPSDHNYTRRSSKIEIIDFDDLELSNSQFEDQMPKHDCNSNDPSLENRNLPADQPSKIVIVADEDQFTEPIGETEGICEKPNDQQDQCKSGADDSDQNFNPKTDFEKLLAKYGDADLYLTRNTSFLEQSHWMLESAINPGSVIEKLKIANEDASKSPVYLDLDQNRIRVSSPQQLPTIIQSGMDGVASIMDSINFPSGGYIQSLGATLTSKPNSCMETDFSNGRMELPLYAHAYETTHATKPLHLRSSSSDFPSLIKSKAVSCQSTVISSFSTSGGSIERILSPIIPKQPSTLEKYPGITVPFQERNNSIPALVPDSIPKTVQQPECRIHLVETPPSFTRSSQIDESASIMSNESHHLAPAKHPRSELEYLNGCQLKTPIKPKRTRRTRAQMEMYRQEMARNNSNHRSRRSQRFPAPPSSHIDGHSFPMGYHQMEEVLPPRFSPYMLPQALQQQRYSGTYSMNETNLFGVSSNSAEWSQSVGSFPTYSHGITQFSSFQPLWPLNPSVRNLNSFASTTTGVNAHECHAPPMGNLQNPPSVMWNQQLRSIQLQQSAYGNTNSIPDGPVGNSRLLTATGRRTYSQWHQELEPNMTNVEESEAINSMRYYYNQ